MRLKSRSLCGDNTKVVKGDAKASLRTGLATKCGKLAPPNPLNPTSPNSRMPPRVKNTYHANFIDSFESAVINGIRKFFDQDSSHGFMPGCANERIRSY